MVAVLASAPAPLPVAIAQARTVDGGQGFCRNAAPLPRLGPEAAPRQQQDDKRYVTRSADSDRAD